MGAISGLYAADSRPGRRRKGQIFSTHEPKLSNAKRGFCDLSLLTTRDENGGDYVADDVVISLRSSEICPYSLDLDRTEAKEA